MADADRICSPQREDFAKTGRFEFGDHFAQCRDALVYIGSAMVVIVMGPHQDLLTETDTLPWCMHSIRGSAWLESLARESLMAITLQG